MNLGKFKRSLDPDFEEGKEFCSNEDILQQMLAKDIKLSSFLGGNPSRILILLVKLILLNFVCLLF